ncbi:ornithine carbamoyltransferase [Spiribacter salinus M19-40]|jgi:ornithine carbamoyltransferase|uniref:Ornithine carbamoyltransferase n=1 Tax=Spiribacter salinus M19-40 TaxID=1260251 RepID=R4VPI2_9GAMM|nr:ornithine carbamoyltransferase [Spiribacter salinus]AGM41413.1 ornithine carbamoyltransferase [Spiribacter salinus M19-40]MBY5269003.1 ornithine carbamoyltransferase [Spiribacter salinus]
MAARHFLTLADLDSTELEALLRRAAELRALHHAGSLHEPLRGRVLGMIFEKSSTRTRVAFEAGMAQLGGSAIFLSPRDSQLGRGEPIEDTARVLCSMVDAVMIRTFAHENVERFASACRVPVINGLTDDHHPCQLLADLQTWQAHRGAITGRTVAWMGDGNNMCRSWMQAAERMGFQLHIGCPADYIPADLDAYPATRHIIDPEEAVKGVDLVVTDVWASMGMEEEQATRLAAFRPYQVNEAIMAEAADDALFMHCLPAHRGEEVSAAVIDGPQSVVWEEAENRLHAQKALLEWLIAGTA